MARPAFPELLDTEEEAADWVSRHRRELASISTAGRLGAGGARYGLPVPPPRAEPPDGQVPAWLRGIGETIGAPLRDLERAGASYRERRGIRGTSEPGLPRGRNAFERTIADIAETGLGGMALAGRAIADGSRPLGERALDVGMGLITPLALPFSLGIGEVEARQVENIPGLGDEYRRRLATLDDYDRERPSSRHAVASEILGEIHDRARGVVQDPNASVAERAAGSVIEGLIKAQRFAEFGGPQGVRALAQLGRWAARNQLGFEAGRAERPAFRGIGAPGEIEVRGPLSPTGGPYPTAGGQPFPPGRYSFAGEGALPAGAASRPGDVAAQQMATAPAWLGALTRTSAEPLGRVTRIPTGAIERSGLPAMVGAGGVGRSGRENSPEVQSQLAQRYMPLAQSIARKKWTATRRAGVPAELDDFLGAALEGLADAAKRADPSEPGRVDAFMRMRIAGAVVDWQRETSGRTRTQLTEIRRKRGAGEPLTQEERTVLSLDEPLRGPEGETGTLADVVAAPVETKLSEGRAKGPAAEAYRLGLARLTPEQRVSLILKDARGLTLEEIAAELGVDFTYVSRLHTAARQQMLAAYDEIVQGRAEGGPHGQQAEPGTGPGGRAGLPGVAGEGVPGGRGRGGPGRGDVGVPGRRRREARGRVESPVRQRARALVARLEREERESGPGAQPSRFFVQKIGARYFVIDRETKTVVERFAGENAKARAEDVAARRNSRIEDQALAIDLPPERAGDLELRPQDVPEEAARRTRIEGEQQELVTREAPAEAAKPLPPPHAQTAIAAELDVIAKRYGFASSDEAAQSILRVRQKAAAEGEGPRVLRMPRPVQERFLAQAEFGAQPLRDVGEIGRDLTSLDQQIVDAQDQLRKAKRSRTRTRYSEAQQRKITTRGVPEESRRFLATVIDDLVARKEQLLREREYGETVRQAGPTREALAESTAIAKAERELPAVEIAPRVPEEAPVEFKRRVGEARGRAIGQREAVEAIRARITETIDGLTSRLGRTEEGREPSARKVAAALKALADDREAAIPRQKIGRKGAVSKKTPEYRMLQAREVQPLLDVRKNLTRTLDRISEIERSGDIEWASLTVEEQFTKLLRDHPSLELDPYLAEFRARTIEDRAEVIAAANEFLATVEKLQLEEGQVPIGNEIRYRRLGTGPEEAGRIRAERESLLLDVRDYLRQAGEMGLDPKMIDPLSRAVNEVIARVKELRDSIDRLELPQVPAKLPARGDYVGSLNLDYIASPLMREAIREHYLKPGNAERIEQATARMSETELRRTTEDLAAMLGHDSDAIAQYLASKNLPGRGDVVRFTLLARETMVAVATDLHDLAVRGIQDERWDKAVATFDSLVTELTGPVSEAARTMRFQQIVVGKPTRVERETGHGLELRERLFEQKDAEWREAVRKAELAAQKALDARQKAQAVPNALTEAAARRTESAALAAEERKTQLKIALDRIEMARIVLEERQRKARLDFLVEGLVHARKRGASPEFLRQLASMDPQTQFQEITNLLRNVDPATRGDKLTAFVMNNMYSGVPANEANFIGNSLRIGIRLFGDPLLSVTYAPLVARLTGRPRAIVPQETAFAFAAFRTATPRALRNVLNILSKGRGAADIAEEIPAGSKFELGAPDVFPGPLGFVAEGVLRGLSAADAAAFHWLYAIEYDTMLVQRAVAKGARTHDAIVASMVDDIIDPPDGLTTMAGQVAADLTYRKALTGLSKALVDFASKRYELPYFGETPVGRWFLTPIMFAWNSMKNAVTAAGAGLVSMPLETWRTTRALAKAGITPAQAVMNDRMALRAGLLGTAGAIMVMDAINAYLSGDLTGGGPTDFERNRIWRDQGNQRYSRRLWDGSWISYEQLWPMSAAYQLVANIGDGLQEGRLRDEDAVQLTGRGILAIATTLGDQPFLRNTHRFYEAIDNAARGGIGRGFESYVASIGQKFVPWSSFMRDIARTLDPYERDPQKFLEFFEAKLPLISDLLDPRLSRWGEDVPQRPGGLGYLSPFRIVQPEHDPVESEVSRIEGIRKSGEAIMGTVGFISDEVAGVDLEPDERHFYQRTAGSLAYGRLQELFGTVSYQGWTDERRAKEIRKTVDVARRDARKVLADKFMGLLKLGDGTQTVLQVSSDSRAKGMRIALNESKSVYARTKLIEKYLPIIDGDADLASAFDEHKGKDTLTLGNYRKLVPLVAWLEKQPEFADEQGRPVGSPAQWAQYHREYREWKLARRDQGPVVARLYYLSHPVLRTYDTLAHHAGGKNPQITIARLRNPLLNRVRLPDEEEDEEALAPAVGE